MFAMPDNSDTQTYNKKHTCTHPPVTWNHMHLKLGFPEIKIQRQPLLKKVYGMGSEKKLTAIISVWIPLWPLLP